MLNVGIPTAANAGSLARPLGGYALRTSCWTGFYRQLLPLDALLVVGLAALAVVLRLPNLQTIPGFSDEVDEIGHSLQILRGPALLLTNYDPYDGSLWNYLLAGALWLSGGSLAAPRLLTMLFGMLTVAAAYPLGRAWSRGSRLGGVLAAALLATSAEHIAINSHVAWSNCITPLFTTLGALALTRAVQGWREGEKERRRDREKERRRDAARPLNHPISPSLYLSVASPSLYLSLAGLCWGLALQTHPSVVGLLPGAAVYVVWRAPGLLRTRWLWIAAGLALLANVNLLAYNLTNGFGSVSSALDQSIEYSSNRSLTPDLYADRFGLLAVGLLQNLSGAIDLREAASDYLSDPGFWAVPLLALAGLIWQWRRGNPLPALLLLSAASILPLLNGNYRPVMDGRYLAPLVVLLYATVASLGAASCSHAARLVGSCANTAALIRRCLFVPVLAFALIHPLVYLQLFYDQAALLGKTNVRFLQIIDAINDHRRSGEPVLIDDLLEHRKLGWSDGRVAHVYGLALDLSGTPQRLANLEDDDIMQPANRCRDQLLLLAMRDPAANEALANRLDLRDLAHRPIQASAQMAGYRLYRLDRLPDAPPSC